VGQAFVLAMARSMIDISIYDYTPAWNPLATTHKMVCARLGKSGFITFGFLALVKMLEREAVCSVEDHRVVSTTMKTEIRPIGISACRCAGSTVPSSRARPCPRFQITLPAKAIRLHGDEKFDARDESGGERVRAARSQINSRLMGSTGTHALQCTRIDLPPTPVGFRAGQELLTALGKWLKVHGKHGLTYQE
jgi:hypothetical protein